FQRRDLDFGLVQRYADRLIDGVRFETAELLIEIARAEGPQLSRPLRLEPLERFARAAHVRVPVRVVDEKSIELGAQVANAGVDAVRRHVIQDIRIHGNDRRLVVQLTAELVAPGLGEAQILQRGVKTLALGLHSLEVSALASRQAVRVALLE